MQSEKADPAYLWDMLDAAKGIRQFVQGRTFQDFKDDRMLRAAVERHLEIIGEAANRVSKAFQEMHSEIPWRGIISQRHVLAHQYGEIRLELIWKVATVHVQNLIANLERCVPVPPEVDT